MEKIYKVKEVAEILRVSEWTVKNTLIKSGMIKTLPRTSKNSAIRISNSELSRYIDARPAE